MSTKQTEKMEVGIVIPENVKVRLAGHMLHVEGPLGKTHKNFKKIPVDIQINNDKIMLKALGERKKYHAILNTSRSLIQTIGRASRHIKGKAIMYADKITNSMKKTIEETSYRRDKQEEYNKKNKIIPKAMMKSFDTAFEKEKQ